jgi:hypothetical protein
MLAAVLVAAVLCVAVLGLHTYLGSNAGGIRAWGAGGTGGQGAGGSTVVQGDVRVGGATAASRTGVDWPPVPADAQTSPIALPPVQQSGSTDYAFIEVVSDTFGPPVRWDPCRPIHVVVNTATAPPGADALLREALAEVSADTGLRFTIEGTTTERPASGRGSVETARYGDRWAPVLVAWTDPSAVPTLQGPVVGLGGPAEASYVDRKDRHYVSGIVYLDGPAFRDILRDPDGRDEARAIVMHEFGHLVGLAHVDTSTELMFSRNIGQVTFGEGDREGLRRLGDGPCFSQ